MTSNPANKIVLITGATGFIGSHLTKRLLTDGWNVHLVVRNTSDLSLLADIRERVMLHHHDGSSEGMRSIMKDAHPRLVFHLASLFIAHHLDKDITPLINSNILFSTQLVNAMTSEGVFRLVNTGTSWQHYLNQMYNPVCLYAATKQAFEAILLFYTLTSPLKVITLKLYDTYGPRDPRQKLFSALRAASRTGHTLEMSPGEQLIDLVYIDDVVNAFLVAGERLLSDDAPVNESYAVSSGKPLRLRDLVDLYIHVSGSPVSIVWGGRAYRDREVMIPWNNGAQLPNWNPGVDLEEGLRRMIESENEKQAR